MPPPLSAQLHLPKPVAYPERQDQRFGWLDMAWREVESVFLKMTRKPTALRLARKAARATALEGRMVSLGDTALKDKIHQLRSQLRVDGIEHGPVIETFAAIREVARRVLGMRPYDVQLVAEPLHGLGQLVDELKRRAASDGAWRKRVEARRVLRAHDDAGRHRRHGGTLFPEPRLAGTAALARAEASQLSVGARQVEAHMLAPRAPRRAGRAAIHARGTHCIHEVPVRLPVAVDDRQPPSRLVAEDRPRRILRLSCHHGCHRRRLKGRRALRLLPSYPMTCTQAAGQARPGARAWSVKTIRSPVEAGQLIRDDRRPPATATLLHFDHESARPRRAAVAWGRGPARPRARPGAARSVAHGADDRRGG